MSIQSPKTLLKDYFLLTARHESTQAQQNMDYHETKNDDEISALRSDRATHKKRQLKFFNSESDRKLRTVMKNQEMVPQPKRSRCQLCNVNKSRNQEASRPTPKVQCAKYSDAPQVTVGGKQLGWMAWSERFLSMH